MGKPLVHAVVSLPLLDVEVRVAGAILQPLVVARLGPDLSVHVGSELKLARSRKSATGLEG